MGILNLFKKNKSEENLNIEPKKKLIDEIMTLVDRINKIDVPSYQLKAYPKGLSAMTEKTLLVSLDFFKKEESVKTAQKLSNDRKYKESIIFCNKVLESEKEGALCIESLGIKSVCLKNLGDFNEALKCSNLASEKDKKKQYTEITLANRGVILKNMGRFKEAIEIYNNLLKKNPNNWEILVNKGSALAMTKRYKEALESYDKALKIRFNETVASWRAGVFEELNKK